MHGGKQPSNRTCCYIEANSYIRLPPCYHVYIPYIDLRDYPYTDQLLAIEGCRRPDAEVKLPSEWYQIITPIHLDFWKEELTSHPDTAFSAWICNGFEKGFRVGYSAKAPPVSFQHVISHGTPPGGGRVYRKGAKLSSPDRS